MGQEELAAISDRTLGESSSIITIHDEEGRKAALNLAGTAAARGFTDELLTVFQMLGLVPTPVEAVWPGCGHPQTSGNTYADPRGGVYCLRCKSSRMPKGRAARDTKSLHSYGTPKQDTP